MRRIAALLLVALLAGVPAAAPAADSLVISVWGGNWKDTIERVVAKPFTAKTGIPVEFEVGGTLDRLAKARVAKGAPLVDITFTTSHVARLYASDGLLEKLDLAKLPQSRDLAKEAFRSEYAIGGWAYVYTIAYRPDQVKTPITKWADLWDPALRGKIAMPDFDPSHIITISALLEGGNEKTWERGQERLKRLKPNIAAFFSTDARSQDLMKTGEAPVEVMLSINAYHLREQGLNVTVVEPKDQPGILGIDVATVMAGSKKTAAAYQFVDLLLSKEIQEQLVASFKTGPTNMKAAVPAALRGQPGVFTSPAEWKERGYLIDDETRAALLPKWKEWFNAAIVAR
ncbi:MAG TPA: ABC transporter substrate-binding protein [Methylomirabilota bacterium]|nr:ABC transporter substrate-binding protein [Methylomirabilota bacterium]